MGKRKKRKIKHGSRGAISIFLVIVLIPCIIFTCIFGDISRVQLSKSQAAGAADLALYALMAHIDNDLKENYGLVASAQDIDSHYAEAANYFAGMMNAESVSGASDNSFVSYINDWASGPAADFLQVEFTAEPKVEELGNSSLRNPALLEDSIVEFMKYRGPIRMFEKFIQRFQKMGISDTLNGADADQPIVDARDEYANAEGDLLKAMYYTYLAIRSYTDVYDNKQVPSLKNYKDYETNLKNIASDYAEITKIITQDYAGTAGIGTVSFPDYNDTYWDQKYNECKKKDFAIKKEVEKNIPEIEINLDGSGGTVETEKKSEPETEEKFYFNKGIFDDLTRNVDTYIQEVQNAADRIANECSNLGDPVSNSDINRPIYCMRVQNAAYNSNNLGTVIDNEPKLRERYAKIRVILEEEIEPLPEDKEIPYDWKKQLEDAEAKIEAVRRDYYSQNSGNPNAYRKIVRNYRAVQDCIPTVQNRSRSFSTQRYQDGTKYTVDAYVKKVCEEFKNIKTDLVRQRDKIDKVLKGGSFEYRGKGYTCVSLDKLVEMSGTFVKSRDKWGSTADSSSSSSQYAQKERAEYHGEPDPEDTSAQLAMAISEDNGQAVKELKDRLTNIRNDIQDFLDVLDNFTYGGQKVVEITNVEQAIQAATTVVPRDPNQISLSLAQNVQDAEGYHRSLLKPSADVYTAPELKQGEDGNDPDLKTDSELFRMMREQFGDEASVIDEEVAKYEKQNKDDEEKAKAKRDSVLGKDGLSNNKYLNGLGTSLESGSGSGTDSFNILTIFKSLIGVVNDLLTGSSNELRDKLYVVEYVMDMFTYSSFNNEGMYKLADDTSLTLNDYDSFTGAHKGEWNTDDKTQIPDNQSLTNWHMNSKHNQMNLGEVEYILFGNTNIEENLKTSYKRIYELRLFLNTLSGFQNFFFSGLNDTATVLDGIANTIMTATCGVIPAPLTKVIVIPILAIFESTNDVERLQAGLPVALYKTSDDAWYYKINKDLTNRFGNKGGQIADKNGLFYSDYMYFFLLIEVTGGYYENVLQRIGDLIEANMKKMGSSDFSLDKAKCFFQLTATLKVKPLMIDLPVTGAMEGVSVDEMKAGGGWNTYEVSFSRGYS